MAAAGGQTRTVSLLLVARHGRRIWIAKCCCRCHLAAMSIQVIIVCTNVMG
jgi:hypothetical protein